MPKHLDFSNLRYCLKNYTPLFLYIRLVGSMGGTVKVDENLKNKVLDFKKNKSGLHMLVDSKEVFNFPLKDYDKGFLITYDRFEKIHNGLKRKFYVDNCYGEPNPYSPIFPEPETSIFRTVLDDHLMQISFKGRIDIKFHSWWDKGDGWKYWTIDRRK